MKKMIFAGAALAAVLASRPRAVAAMPRADAQDPSKVLADLQQAWADMQAGLGDQIKAKADVLIDEKVERINTSVGDLQRAIDELNLKAKAAELNAQAAGDKKRQPTEAERAYTAAFQTYLRTGEGKAELQAAAKALGPQAALSVGSDPDGGYLVPFEMDPTVDRVHPVQGGLSSVANVRPNVKGDRYKKLISQGGATTGWVGEAEARASTSTPTLAEIEIVLGEVYANAPATQQILDDATETAAWLEDEVLTSMDEAENAAFVTGSGIKRPRGLMDYTFVANSSYAWGSVGFIVTGGAADFASTTPDNALYDMQSALKQMYRPNASWIANRTVIGKVRKFKDTTGQPLWQPSTQMGQPSTLLGHPVVEDDNFADVGSNAYPLAYGDFKKAYTIVRKAGLVVNLRDPYTNKPYVQFYLVRRVGGGITNFEAFKVLKCST